MIRGRPGTLETCEKHCVRPVKAVAYVEEAEPHGHTVLIPMAAPLLMEVLDQAASPVPEVSSADALAWRAFAAARRNLTERLECDAGGMSRLHRFITASHDLPAGEVRETLEYLFSHLVSKYQGALGELFAARELGAWMSEQVGEGTLGGEVRLIAGNEILERSTDGTGAQWRKGADGLLVVPEEDADRLLIAGVIEIKSFPTTFAKLVPQIELHLRRLRHGVRLGERDLAGDQLAPTWWDGNQGWRVGGDDDWSKILRVAVSTKHASPRRVEASIAPSHYLQIPLSRATLAAVAFELTVRFLERVGAAAFAAGSPWPEMSPEEASINAIKETLYHIIYEERAGSEHALWVASRLYNVYGFGYQAADGRKEMMWPEEDDEDEEDDDMASGDLSVDDAETAPVAPVARSSPDRVVRAVVDEAWRLYRAGALLQAGQWAAAAVAITTDGKLLERLRWLRGMVKYHRADFLGAVEVLPEPGTRPTPDDGWWAKNMLTLARARVRLGEADHARALLEQVAAENLAWSYLPIALPAVRGWLESVSGDRAGAEVHLVEATTHVHLRLAEREKRIADGLGDPPYHDSGAIEVAIVDAAGLAATLEKPCEAMRLLDLIDAPFPPLRALVAVDPVFGPLRRDERTRMAFAGWSDGQSGRF